MSDEASRRFKVTGTSLAARLFRGLSWTALGHVASQATRLVSSLVLTRLLFPEAFGLMALVGVFTTGLLLMSDAGIGPAIQQHQRGDDPDFVNTAWTVQVCRGVLLTLICVLLGPIAAHVYDTPDMLFILPMAGLALLISGFTPTRVETAYRHLALGRLTLLELVSQLLSLIVTIALAFAFRSVWALVLGMVAGSIVRLALLYGFLPGLRNTFKWDRMAAHDLLHFGKWIFLSTMCAFFIVQGDKLVLGFFLSLEKLGVYNTGLMLAGVVQALMTTIVSRAMLPIYRDRPPADSVKNFQDIRRLRFALTAATLTLQFALALGGVGIVSILYDDRFAGAGAVLVGVACMNVPYLIGMTYDHVALARGDSRSLFLLVAFKAVAQTVLFLIGGVLGGLGGALIGAWLSQVLGHSVVVWLARRYGAWDLLHDAIYFPIGLALTILTLALNQPALAQLDTFWSP